MNIVHLQDVKKVFSNRITPHEPTVGFHLEDFAVADGDQIALTGPSGCGKSTLLDLISGIVRPDQGSIEVGGTRVDQLPAGKLDRFRGRHFGYVFQNFNLVPALSVIDN